jgi:hypothetical protein
MSRRAAAGIARRDGIPRRLRSPGQGSADRGRSSGLGRKPAAARSESRVLETVPRPRTGDSQSSRASALASDPARPPGSCASEYPRISFERGISGNLPGRRFEAGKESPGWTLPADLPDREGAREASMREAGKPFPGRMGIEPKTFCERVESRRQNQACPRQLRPGQAFGNPMDGPGWPPGGNGGEGRSPGEGRGGGPMRGKGKGAGSHSRDLSRETRAAPLGLRDVGKPPGEEGMEPEAFCERVESRRQNGTRPQGRIEPPAALSGLLAGPGKGARPSGTLPGRGGSASGGAAASGFGGPDLRVVRPAIVVEDAKKRASIALFRDSSARRRAGLISPGRRRESVSIPPWGFPGRSGEGAGGVCLPLLGRAWRRPSAVRSSPPAISLRRRLVRGACAARGSRRLLSPILSGGEGMGRALLAMRIGRGAGPETNPGPRPRMPAGAALASGPDSRSLRIPRRPFRFFRARE